MKLNPLQKKQSFFVYMLFNDQGKVSYVGYTVNLENRLKAHNSNKGAKFTRGKKWRLIFSKKFKTKVLAMKFEYKFKKDRILRKKMILKFAYNQGLPS